ncbi:TOBE domain-containing protein [Sulfurimonas sp. HSL3-7]|uniref:TOBE domain-containing protein n=1 Tax=Sulfonitrofixus jiaomeiensis TaxID=3131938 RepID=UPI0031FA0562
MKISARNQIEAAVTAVEKGAVNAAVTLKAPMGTELSAIITNQSAEMLGLEAGQYVTGFFKASHVLIAIGGIPNISARNKLKGSVVKITKGAVNSEIDVKLVSGDIIVAIITNEAVTDLSLKEGSEVFAIIKSTDVMIAK